MNPSRISTDRQMKASIGFSIQDWKKLSVLLEEHHQNIYGISLEEKFRNMNIKPILATHQEIVFFVLFQLKNSLSYDALGAVFETNGSNAQKNFNRYLPMVRAVLAKLLLLPIRDAQQLDWNRLVEQEKEIYLDATEIPVQRPVNEEDQKALYSGKKKRTGGKAR